MRVLLIEDDPRLGEQLVPAIERAGYECDWARDMSAGARTFESGRFDLVVLDLMLPDGSGFRLLEAFRQASQIPVIVISARILGEDKVRALDLGADDYVTKPFWTNELTARIRAVLRRRSPSPGPMEFYRFGTVAIDLVGRNLRIANKPKAITPTEFALLEFFVRRPHQALRRERIIDAVFRNPDSATEALQTHISRLRRKLGPDGACIETVWGIGYRFDPGVTGEPEAG